MLEAALVAWLVAVLGDRALTGLRALTFGKPERAALGIAMGVASKALLERVPPTARDEFADVLRDCLARPLAITFDAEVTVKTAIVEGLLAQVRPLTDATITPSGRSYLSEIGADEDQIVAALPDLVIRAIQQVGAKHSALLPLVGQLNSDIIQADIRQVLDTVQALLVMERAAPALAPVTRPRRLTITLLEPVIDAMELVPAVSDYAARNSIINSLPPDMQGTIARSPIARIEIMNTVKTCANYTSGLNELMSVIRLIEGDSEAMRHLDRTILALTQNDLVRSHLEGEDSA